MGKSVQRCVVCKKPLPQGTEICIECANVGGDLETVIENRDSSQFCKSKAKTRIKWAVKEGLFR